MDRNLQITNLGKVYKSQMYRVYLLFMMNAKYISSSVVKNQYYHECAARVYQLIFSPHVWYLPKKSLNFMYFMLRRIKESKLNFLVVSCTIWQFRITLGFHHSLHLENGLEEHFNE